jgi:hypothetical protein
VFGGEFELEITPSIHPRHPAEGRGSASASARLMIHIPPIGGGRMPPCGGMATGDDNNKQINKNPRASLRRGGILFEQPDEWLLVAGHNKKCARVASSSCTTAIC